MKEQQEQEQEGIRKDDAKHFLKLQILQKAKESKERQLSINLDTQNFEEIDKVKEILSKSFDDPEEKFDLYYKAIRKVIMKYLPKGKEFKEERDIIYEEKNIFLTRGKAKNKRGIRGGDSRMGYNDDMYELVNLITDWVSMTQDPVDLYQRIYDLNDKYNYGHRQYDDSSKDFHKAMSESKTEK
ncbi:hypothetical protein OA93_23420 [Flavobacterium sp. KMS]|uniref:hypothetical protein n=1 Tax=Flavobacterium sp. KMS TaxID=1566023 RepID=UPI00057EDD6C|nr:hypothetical protein [Flavobacterium sp. KMS]KIA92484.1 hypothetical protein OA93_23420 [Flavobacterium sp. KMS]